MHGLVCFAVEAGASVHKNASNLIAFAAPFHRKHGVKTQECCLLLDQSNARDDATCEEFLRATKDESSGTVGFSLDVDRSKEVHV